MYCPRCGSAAPPGTRRCTACGAPFTRQELARQSTRRPAPRAAARGSYRRYERGSGAGRALLAWVVVVALTVVAVFVLMSVLSKSVVKPYVGNLVEKGLSNDNGASIVLPTTIPVPTRATGSTAAPGTSGEQIVITEQQLNDGIAQHAAELSPLDNVRVQITDKELLVNMSAHGVQGRYRGQVVVRDGKPVVTNGRIDGMLGWVIPTNQLEAALNQQIAAAVTKSGVTVQQVTLQPGQMVLDVAT